MTIVQQQQQAQSNVQNIQQELQSKKRDQGVDRINKYKVDDGAGAAVGADAAVGTSPNVNTSSNPV